MNENNKKSNKNKKKMPLFTKNVVQFGFFVNEMEFERGKQDFSSKVIVLNVTNVLIFQYKNARKATFKKCYTIGLFQLLQGKFAKEFADMFSLKIKTIYNIVSYPVLKKDSSA